MARGRIIYRPGEQLRSRGQMPKKKPAPMSLAAREALADLRRKDRVRSAAQLEDERRKRAAASERRARVERLVAIHRPDGTLSKKHCWRCRVLKRELRAFAPARRGR